MIYFDLDYGHTPEHRIYNRLFRIAGQPNAPTTWQRIPGIAEYSEDGLGLFVNMSGVYQIIREYYSLQSNCMEYSTCTYYHYDNVHSTLTVIDEWEIPKYISPDTHFWR